MSDYVVTALAVVPTLDTGISMLIERGGMVPGNATEDWLEMALDRDLIAEVSGPVGGFAPPTSGDGTVLDGLTDGNVVVDGEPVGELTEPVASAKKAAWVAYATQLADGDADELEKIDGMTQAQLIEAYGTPAS